MVVSLRAIVYTRGTHSGHEGRWRSTTVSAGGRTVSDGTDRTLEEQVEEAMEAFQKRLQEEGLKSTKQRDLIVERFFRLDEHISADELLEDVREYQPRIGYATVYRTLKLLVDQGFAVPKDFGDGQTRYDPIHNQDPQHDHLICVDCRKIEEFNDDVLNDRIQAIVDDMKYRVRRKKIELYVECTDAECPRK